MHMGIVTSEGESYTWGLNTSQQLGHSFPSNKYMAHPHAPEIPHLHEGEKAWRAMDPFIDLLGLGLGLGLGYGLGYGLGTIDPHRSLGLAILTPTGIPPPGGLDLVRSPRHVFDHRCGAALLMGLSREQPLGLPFEGFDFRTESGGGL